VYEGGKRMSRERGSSLLEMLVGVTILSGLLAGVMSTFSLASKAAYDDQLYSRANEEARISLDTISYDIRMAGSGMPLGQSGFQPGGTGLGDAPLAILTTSNNQSISIRLNELGRDTVLQNSYSPSAANLTFSVLSTQDIYEGDTIYISDAVEGGSKGLRATVTAIAGNTLTIAPGYNVSSGSVSFAAGSTVNRVTTVTYSNAADGSGITRDNGVNVTPIVPASSVSFRYFDRAGVELAPPLTDASIRDVLTGVEVTVAVRSTSPLRNGTFYQTSAQQRVALRNLSFNR